MSKLVFEFDMIKLFVCVLMVKCNVIKVLLLFWVFDCIGNCLFVLNNVCSSFSNLGVLLLMIV